MLISRNWLQTFFSTELPLAEELEKALTFHAFEIDGVEAKEDDYILDVKITPNRGHDCLCHRGIAKELSAILKLPMKRDPLNTSSSDLLIRTLEPELGALKEGSSQEALVQVRIDTPLCNRYIAGYMKGVKVGPSPEWLKNRLEALGQRPINNIVDATNYVMFELGQPLHAFDAGKLAQKDGRYHISVRPAQDGEKLLALDEKEYQLDSSMLVIADANKSEAIGVAGVKGGMPAGINEATTDIILESANFDGISVRKTAQKLKLRTDASARFEQVISPNLAAYAMREVSDLIVKIAGGEVVEFVDVYPDPKPEAKASVTVEKINQVLGITLTGAEVADVFQRLGFAYKEESGLFEVVAPFERLDIAIAEDLIEEVGRIIGYDRVPGKVLPPFTKAPEINKNFYWAEKIREYLTSQGFSEVYTSVFADKGERVILNKVDGVRPYMRTELKEGLIAALLRNIPNKDLLSLNKVKIFEIGTIWNDGREEIHVCTIEENSIKKISGSGRSFEFNSSATEKSLEAFAKEIGLTHVPTQYDNLPISNTERYQVFSKFPYMVRDVAVWVPNSIESVEVLQLIEQAAGELCGKVTLFDRFEKPASPDGGESKVSLAYRLIFQSFDRTLTDNEANAAMEKVYAVLKAKGFEIR